MSTSFSIALRINRGLALLSVLGIFLGHLGSAVALDMNGDFESKQEKDAFIAVTLNKMAREMNAQTPIQVDEDTRIISVISLQKTITFIVRLPRYRVFEVDPNQIAQTAKENLNHVVCRSKATRDLIDQGVEYVYLYNGSDGKLITRVAIKSYRC